MAWTYRRRLERLFTRTPRLKPNISAKSSDITKAVLTEHFALALPDEACLRKRLNRWEVRWIDNTEKATPLCRTPLLALLDYHEERSNLIVIRENEMEGDLESVICLTPVTVNPPREKLAKAMA